MYAVAHPAPLRVDNGLRPRTQMRGRHETINGKKRTMHIASMLLTAALALSGAPAADNPVTSPDAAQGADSAQLFFYCPGWLSWLCNWK